MAEEVQLTVKYLSSPKLLRLQLQDAALRRHFLVQVIHPAVPPSLLLRAGRCIQLQGVTLHGKSPNAHVPLWPPVVPLPQETLQGFLTDSVQGGAASDSSGCPQGELTCPV